MRDRRSLARTSCVRKAISEIPTVLRAIISGSSFLCFRRRRCSGLESSDDLSDLTCQSVVVIAPSLLMSSPMMMSSGSAATIRLPPATATAAFPPSSFRQRGHSVSTLREFDHLSGSSFRSRARSPTRFDDPIPKKDAGHTPPSNSPSGWWNEWRDPPAKKENAPADHTEAWVETRQVSRIGNVLALFGLWALVI